MNGELHEKSKRKGVVMSLEVMCSVSRMSQVAALVALVCGGGVSFAQTTTEDASPAQGSLKAMVVSASRAEQDTDDVPTTITTVTSDDLNKKAAADLREALDDEVGVSVRAVNHRVATASGTSRAGQEGVNIRGLEGNQVRMQIDGVSLPSSFSFGQLSTGRGEYVDVEGYKQIEILRGAASTQYGSDGLSGSVSFVTKDPEDYLKNGKTEQFSLKASYSSADKGWQLAPSYAFKGEEWQGLILASMRRSQETQTMGNDSTSSASRTAADPQSNRSDYVLAKLGKKISADHAIKLTVESINKETNTDDLSQLTTAISSDVSRETVKRTLAKVDYTYTPQNTWVDVLNWSLYAQTSEAVTASWQTRTSGSYSARSRIPWYDDDSVGSSVQLESNWGDETTHRLIYGADVRFSKQSMLANRTGDYSTPDKYFPDTRSDSLGAFVQDEIKLGAVSITPGLRYDWYTISPKTNSTDSSAVTYKDLSDSALSPKLGVVWALRDDLSLYGQYSRGFRAPAAYQVNGGYVGGSGSFSYKYIGNPDLKSEKSDSVEFGVRGNSQRYKYSTAVFYGDYSDFLYQQQSGSSPTIYQYVNLDKVKIYGFEYRGAWKFNDRWSLDAAYAHTEGIITTGKDGAQNYLATVDPDKLVTKLSLENGQVWGNAVRMTAVERNSRAPSTTTIVPGGYTVFDYMGWYNLDKNTQFTYGVYNLFDKKYVAWSDIRSLTSASTIDAYTQTGRNFKVAVIHNF